MTRLANPIPNFTFLILALAFLAVEATHKHEENCDAKSTLPNTKCYRHQGISAGLIIGSLFGTPRLFTHFHLVDPAHQDPWL
jgi:hypothetical protein